jgi:proline dehydrogenase
MAVNTLTHLCRFTGAGSFVTKALMQNADPPADFVAAMDAICARAAAKDVRIWIDAEQQVLQEGIDRWTIDLMRRYNPDGKALVYNTLQAYLKASRVKLREQLALAHKEGWTLAIKLVRGAYIDNDCRELIHDTKQDTDNSYNGIVRDLLSGSNLGFAGDDFPKDVRLFLAGHNPDSVGAAWALVQTLSSQGKLKVLPDFGQLQVRLCNSRRTCFRHADSRLGNGRCSRLQLFAAAGRPFVRGGSRFTAHRATDL